VDEVVRLRDEHGAKHFFFIDSVFNDTEGEYLNVLAEMKSRSVSVPWTAFFRPSGLDDRTVGLLRETGLVSAELGSDASTDTTLRRMGKDFTFDDIRNASGLFSKHGVAAVHFYIFGGPGETRETAMEGIDNILSIEDAIHMVYLGIRIIPNTRLERLAIKENIISEDDNLLWPAYYFSPQVDRKWLEQTLNEAFSQMKNCIYPPDAVDGILQTLHDMGYSGPLWEYLLATIRKRKKRAR
jgi:radical SAM superfamily enzyme YgiQ (UPF0313 family)